MENRPTSPGPVAPAAATSASPAANRPQPGDAAVPAGANPGGADTRGLAPEIGGPEGLEPTRYGDWERKGRCIDF